MGGDLNFQDRALPNFDTFCIPPAVSQLLSLQAKSVFSASHDLDQDLLLYS